MDAACKSTAGESFVCIHGSKPGNAWVGAWQRVCAVIGQPAISEQFPGRAPSTIIHYCSGCISAFQGLEAVPPALGSPWPLLPPPPPLGLVGRHCNAFDASAYR